VAPDYVYGYRYAVTMLRTLGREEEAKKIVDEWKQVGNTTPLE
jgi:hypothetical protein